MAPQFFFTVHDEAGNRIDDDSDFPLSESQLDAALANLDEVTINGETFYRQFDGRLLRYQQVAE